MVNPDCVKELMIHINNELPKQTRKNPKVKLRDVHIDGFSQDEIFEAGKYIADCGFVDVHIDGANTHYSKGRTRNYRFTGFRPPGQEFLHAATDENIWNRLKRSGLLSQLPGLVAAGETIAKILEKIK